MATPPAAIAVRSVWAHLLGVGLTAVLLALCFPEPGWWPLAFVALVPMGLLSVRSVRRGRLAWTSWLVFFVWWLWMARWMTPVTAGGYVLLSAGAAAYFAAVPVALNLLHRRFGSAMVLALPLVWVSQEFLRSHLPLGGFGWFSLGHALAPYLPEQGPGRLVQTADLFGELTVSFIVAMTAGLTIDLLARPLLHATGGRRRWRRATLAAVATWLVVFVGALVYGHLAIARQPAATQPGPRIAVIQTSVPQDNKNFPTPEQQVRDFERMVTLTRDAAANHPPLDLIVWPETMVPAPLNAEVFERYPDAEVFHELIARTARAVGAPMLVGSHAYYDWREVTLPDGRTGEVPAKRYNSVYLYHADGVQAPLRYDKMHRVPFGEYIPWIGAIPPLKDLFLRYLSPYGFDYSLQPGERIVHFELPVRPPVAATQPAADVEVEPATPAPATVRLAAPICYEDAVARVSRRLIYGPQGRKQADMLVNLTNSAWYPDSHQQAQHLQIATFRAIENRVPVARSVNYGISGFIDSVGRVGPIIEVDGRHVDVDGSVVHRVHLDERVTLFGRLGELPMIALTVLTGLMVLAALLRRRGPAPAERR